MTDRHSPAEAGLLFLPAPRGPREDPGGARRGPLPLPGTPWLLRTAGGRGARPSLEVYAAGVLLDVIVATPLSVAVLCGGCSAGTGAGTCSLAWGRLPADGAAVTVEFARPGLPRRRRAAAVAEVDRSFWVATASGRFTTVTAAHRDGRERRRMRWVRP